MRLLLYCCSALLFCCSNVLALSPAVHNECKNIKDGLKVTVKPSPLTQKVTKLCVTFERNNKCVLPKKVQVGVASYQKYDEIIDNQTLFQGKDSFLYQKPLKICVNVPKCASQLDWFHGHVLQSLKGQRYGSRLIGAFHTNNCTSGTGKAPGRCNLKNGCIPKYCKKVPPPTDCAGVPNGTATLDKCGVCGGDNSTCKDCAGIIHGNTVIDKCGVCGGDNSTCKDCADVINGNTVIDECGVCGGDNSTCKDCAGTPNGDAVIDECGVCDGQNNTCLDCAGIINGNTVIDECGVCDGDGSSCIEHPPVTPPVDCAGTPFGTLVVDDCGVCGGDSSTCTDCAGIPNGGTKFDECGVCDGKGKTTKTLKINKKRLIREQRVVVRQRTIPYFQRIVQCDRNQTFFANSETKKTRRIFKRYRNLVNSLQTEVSLCAGECVRGVNKNKLKRLKKLNKRIYSFAYKAQHGARNACKNTEAGVKATRPLTNKINREINNCEDSICK